MFSPSANPMPMSKSTATRAANAAVTLFHFFANRSDDSAPRAEETTPRTDAEIAEEWTRECLFDCYND